MTSNVRPLTSRSRAQPSETAHSLNESVSVAGLGLVALSCLAAADKQRACLGAGKRFYRGADDDGVETELVVWLICRLSGDRPVVLDVRAIAIDLDRPPDRIREAADWLTGIRAIVVDGHDSRCGEPYVWINPSLGHSPGVDAYVAARRHRFPRITMDDTQLPNVPAIEEFEDLV